MAPNPFDIRVLIRGGGEMASGIAHRLRQCHMEVLITEVAEPTAVRRKAAAFMPCAPSATGFKPGK